MSELYDSNMLPQYSTILFTDVWNNVDSFKTDYAATPLAGAIDASHQNILFYLLYARYGNNPIANYDITQWKFKIFSIIYQYGPTWQKKLDLQGEIRTKTAADLKEGATMLFNHALNPSTTPSTDAETPLTYINEQKLNKYKRSLGDAYANLWNLLADDVSEEFIVRFRPCFKVFVSPEHPVLYETDTDDSEVI